MSSAPNLFGFRSDEPITDVVAKQKFTFSAEVIPPRNGAEQEKILHQISCLCEAGAQFLSVTKGAGGSLRGGSLPIAQTVKERFTKPVIAHFTCRDITPQEVENQLMDHHYFGVRNILALRGDPPQDQPDWDPAAQSLQYAYQLIEQIRKMNDGEFLKRPGGRNPEQPERTDFCIGAAVYPEFPEEQKRYDYFLKKVEAGAQYAISQMIFDDEAYGRFLDRVNLPQIPILPGSLILKSQKQAAKIAERFEVSVPKRYFEALPEEREDGDERAIELFLKYVESLRSRGAPGIHLFVLSDTKGCSAALKELKRLYADS